MQSQQAVKDALLVDAAVGQPNGDQPAPAPVTTVRKVGSSPNGDEAPRTLCGAGLARRERSDAHGQQRRGARARLLLPAAQEECRC